MLKLPFRHRLPDCRFLGSKVRVAAPRPCFRPIAFRMNSSKTTPAHIGILHTITNPTARWIFFHPPPRSGVTTNWEEETACLRELSPSEHVVYRKAFLFFEATLKKQSEAHAEALEKVNQKQKKYFFSEGFFWLRSNFLGAVVPHMNIPPITPTVFDTLNLSDKDIGWYVYFSAHDLGVEMYEATNPRPRLHNGGEASRYSEWLAGSSWTDLMAYGKFEPFMRDALGEVEKAELERYRSVYDRNFVAIQDYQFALEERIARFAQVLEDGLRLGWLRPLPKSMEWLKKLSHRPSADIGSIWL